MTVGCPGDVRLSGLKQVTVLEQMNGAGLSNSVASIAYLF